MPLIKGYSVTTVAANIRKMRNEGKPPNQAIAAAFSVARKALEAAGKRETKAITKSWTEAVPRALEGTSKTSKGNHHYRVRFKPFKGSKIEPFIVDVTASSLQAAGRKASAGLSRRRWISTYVDKIVRGEPVKASSKRPARASSRSKTAKTARLKKNVDYLHEKMFEGPRLKMAIRPLADTRTAKSKSEGPKLKPIAGTRVQPIEKKFFRSMRYFVLRPVPVASVDGHVFVLHFNGKYVIATKAKAGFFLTNAHPGKVTTFRSASEAERVWNRPYVD